MIELATVQRSLRGAWRMLKHDADGLSELDLTYNGFWASFWAIAIGAPFAFIAIAAEPAMLRALPLDVQPPPFAFIPVEMIGYAVSWLSFPVVMVYLSRMLDLSGKYVPMIVAYNWCTLLITLSYGPAYILFSVGLFGLLELLLITMIVWTASIYLLWFALRTAIGGQGTTAFGLVLINQMLILITAYCVALVHGWPGPVDLPS